MGMGMGMGIALGMTRVMGMARARAMEAVDMGLVPSIYVGFYLGPCVWPGAGQWL